MTIECGATPSTSLRGALATIPQPKLNGRRHILSLPHDGLLRFARCDHNFAVVKIGLDGETHILSTMRRLMPNSRGGTMVFKRMVQQAATAALILAAAQPASAQQVLKVGSTPTGI